MRPISFVHTDAIVYQDDEEEFKIFRDVIVFTGLQSWAYLAAGSDTDMVPSYKMVDPNVARQLAKALTDWADAVELEVPEPSI